eukprot:jgi/Mesen1/8654/ME000502S08015
MGFQSDQICMAVADKKGGPLKRLRTDASLGSDSAVSSSSLVLAESSVNQLGGKTTATPSLPSNALQGSLPSGQVVSSKAAGIKSFSQVNAGSALTQGQFVQDQPSQDHSNQLNMQGQLAQNHMNPGQSQLLYNHSQSSSGSFNELLPGPGISFPQNGSEAPAQGTGLMYNQTQLCSEVPGNLANGLASEAGQAVPAQAGNGFVYTSDPSLATNGAANQAPDGQGPSQSKSQNGNSNGSGASQPQVQLTTGVVLTGDPPCAACKSLRRKCTRECIFLPYFPRDDPDKFARVHKVFGASNVAKMLNDLPVHQREDAVASLEYEAQARCQDPVYGCVGILCVLQRQVATLRAQLALVHAQAQHSGLQFSSSLDSSFLTLDNNNFDHSSYQQQVQHHNDGHLVSDTPLAVQNLPCQS